MQAPQRMQRSISSKLGAEHGGAAVVEEDDVVVLRPVRIAVLRRGPVEKVV